jgi:two-component system response regulator RpaA
MVAMAENAYTAAQVAHICNVPERTVNKWFDSKRLGGYRIPGEVDGRRIPFDDLMQFLERKTAR